MSYNTTVPYSSIIATNFLNIILWLSNKQYLDTSYIQLQKYLNTRSSVFQIKIDKELGLNPQQYYANHCQKSNQIGKPTL